MTNYGPKKLYYVPAQIGQTDPANPATGYSVNYVFESNQLTSVLNELGCIPITAPDQLKTLDAASVASFYAAPKNRPRRATQRTSTGYNTGFHAKGTVLTGSTWLSGGFGAKPSPKASPLFTLTDVQHHSVSVYVTLGILKYAWNMSKVRHAKLMVDLPLLGIEYCKEADRNQYIWGADAPKPAIFVKEYLNGNNVESISGFVDRAKNNGGAPIVSGTNSYNLLKGEVTLFSLLSQHKSFQ